MASASAPSPTPIPPRPISDFTGTDRLGRRLAQQRRRFVSNLGEPAGTFDVYGSHTYAKLGSYTVTTNVLDEGGSTTTLYATFNVTDPPITGVSHNFTSVEGQSTGTVVLATITDPNTLATAADITARFDSLGRRHAAGSARPCR